MTSRAVMAAFGLATLAAAAGGCGADQAPEARTPDAESEARRVRQVWLERLARGDADACDLLTGRARFAFVSEDTGACFLAVERFAASITAEERRAFSNVRVRRVTVKANRARIEDRDLITPSELYSLRPTNGRPMTFRRIDGRWRIDRIG